MPIVGKFFPSQKSHEKVFLLLRRHWFTYFGFVFMAVIMIIPVIYLIIYWIDNPDVFSGIGGNLAILGLFTYLLLVWGMMLYGFIDYYLDVYIITNERIVNIEQSGFFRREISELHLHQIQDVSARVKGIFPTLIHYGDVYIQTAGEQENFIFKSIPNPYRVSKLIVDLHEAQLEEGSHEVEGEVRAEGYVPPPAERPRDMVDLENIEPLASDLAAEKTKEFMNSNIPEEADLKAEIQNKLNEKKDEKLLNGLGAAEVKSDQPKLQKPETKASPSKRKKKGFKEGEMHENEEIDF